MSTTSRQDSDFIDAVISNTLLESAIEWIQTNLAPEDVFDEDQLQTWAANQGLVAYKEEE